MVIFLYGADDLRREEKKKWYIKEFEKKHSGLSVRTFDFADGSDSSAMGEKMDIPEEFKGFARAQPIFESKKLAILENLYEADEEKLKDTLREVVAKKDTFVLCSERGKPAKALDFLLEAPATVEKFEFLTGYEWEIFAKGRAKKLGLEFSDFAFKFLVAVYQNNTWGLVTELEKISNLKNGSTSLTTMGVVDKKDLAGLDLEIAPDYWALFGGLRSQDLKTRVTALEKLFAIGDSPPKIFNILASGWREKIPQMAEYDLKIKSGKLDYEEVLVDLAIS